MRSPVLRRRSRHPAREAKLLLTLGLVGAAVAPRAAHADPGDACVSAYEEAQRTRKEGAWVKSKANLRLCVGACPDALAADCRAWQAEVDQQIGRLWIDAKAKDATVLRGARLAVDDLERPLGAAVELDPGKHRVRVEAPGFHAVELELAIAAGGEVRRAITLEPGASDAAGPPSVVPPALLAGAGGLLLLAAGALTLVGHLDVSDMRSSCAPNCEPARVETVRAMWIAAGVGAGVGGAVAIGAGVWLGLSLSAGGPRDEAPAPSSVAARVGFRF